MMPRAATRRPRVVHPRPSDRSMQAPSRVRHREYSDGDTSVLEETTVVIMPRRPRSRPPSRSLTSVSAIEQLSANRRDTTESNESNQEDHRQHYHGESRAPSRSRRARRRHRRRRSRHSDRDGGGESFGGL